MVYRSKKTSDQESMPTHPQFAHSAQYHVASIFVAFPIEKFKQPPPPTLNRTPTHINSVYTHTVSRYTDYNLTLIHSKMKWSPSAARSRLLPKWGRRLLENRFSLSIIAHTCIPNIHIHTQCGPSKKTSRRSSSEIVLRRQTHQKHIQTHTHTFNVYMDAWVYGGTQFAAFRRRTTMS